MKHFQKILGHLFGINNPYIKKIMFSQLKIIRGVFNLVSSLGSVGIHDQTGVRVLNP